MANCLEPMKFSLAGVTLDYKFSLGVNKKIKKRIINYAMLSDAENKFKLCFNAVQIKSALIYIFVLNHLMYWITIKSNTLPIMYNTHPTHIIAR